MWSKAQGQGQDSGFFFFFFLVVFFFPPFFLVFFVPGLSAETANPTAALTLPHSLIGSDIFIV
jgi:hypothetical protein